VLKYFVHNFCILFHTEFADCSWFAGEVMVSSNELAGGNRMKALATLLVLTLTGSCFASDPSSPVRAKKAGSVQVRRANFNGNVIGLQVPGIVVAVEPSLKEKLQNTLGQIEHSPLTRIALGVMAPSMIVVDRERNWFANGATVRMARLLNESDDLRQARLEMQRFWMNNQPAVLQFECLNGAIAP
jgi:hypothetical protein